MYDRGRLPDCQRDDQAMRFYEVLQERRDTLDLAEKKASNNNKNILNVKGCLESHKHNPLPYSALKHNGIKARPLSIRNGCFRSCHGGLKRHERRVRKKMPKMKRQVNG